MKDGKKWQDWLTSIGTVIALILAGVTFYYQFIRKPQELRAAVLPITWEGGESVIVRVVIWNDGTRDEVLESINLLAEYTGEGQAEQPKYLIGPEVIKPGEAKAFTVKTNIATLDEFRRFAMRHGPMAGQTLPTPKRGQESVSLRVEFKTIDRDGGVIVSRAEGGQLVIGQNDFMMMAGATLSKRINLLTGESLGDALLGLEGMP